MSTFLRQSWAKRIEASNDWEPDSIRGYPLPVGGQFSPSKSALDPDIFDAHEVMHSWISGSLIAIMDAFWAPRYPDWKDWSRVYLAGSLASYWWNTLDFDILIGVHTPTVVKLPQFRGLADQEVCKALTAEFYTGLDPYTKSFTFPPAPDVANLVAKLGGPSTDAVYAYVPPNTKPLGPVDEITFYANAKSWDIREIRPYAAYEILHDRWWVHPGRMSRHWGPKSLPWSFWEHTADLADEIKHALSTDDPTERMEDAKALYARIHKDRSDAYGSSGRGMADKGSLQWIALVRWGLVGALEQAIHPDRPAPHLAPPGRVAGLHKDEYGSVGAHHDGYEVRPPSNTGYQRGDYGGGYSQSDNRISAHDSEGNEVGNLDYSHFKMGGENSLNIHYIHVHPDHRGHNLGRVMYHVMRANHPGGVVNPGSFTDEGSDWWNSKSMEHAKGTQL